MCRSAPQPPRMNRRSEPPGRFQDARSPSSNECDPATGGSSGIGNSSNVPSPNTGLAYGCDALAPTFAR
jgi:hypothetical protein